MLRTLSEPSSSCRSAHSRALRHTHCCAHFGTHLHAHLHSDFGTHRHSHLITVLGP